MKLYISKTQTFSYKRWLNLIFILLGFILVVYLYLIMPNLTRQEDLQPFLTTHFAHRGIFDNRCYIPENSLVAFQKAIDYGYGIELDVQLTKDKVPVVAHDYNLNRLCNANINISSLTFEELSQYPLFQSIETIPSLEEALNLVDGQVPLMIELKVGLSYKETCKKVAQVLKDYKGDYCIISFSPLALHWFRSHMPQVIRGQLSTNYFKDYIDGTPTIKFMLSHLLLNFMSRPDFISYNYRYTSDFSLKICQYVFKTPIALWTIRDEENYNLLFKNYNMLLFDSFLPPPTSFLVNEPKS